MAGRTLVLCFFDTSVALAPYGCTSSNDATIGRDSDIDGPADAGADIADATLEPASLTIQCSHYQQTKIKCSSELRGRGATPVIGLTLADFTVTEQRIDDATSETLETNVCTFEDPPSYQFDGPGFWEQSLTAAKTDIVFVIDQSGTMKEHLDDTRAAIEGLITRLQANHVDFRMRFVEVESTPSATVPYPFRSTMEVDRIREDLELATTSGA